MCLCGQTPTRSNHPAVIGNLICDAGKNKKPRSVYKERLGTAEGLDHLEWPCHASLALIPHYRGHSTTSACLLIQKNLNLTTPHHAVNKSPIKTDDTLM